MDMIAFLSHFHTDCLSVGSFSLKITKWLWCFYMFCKKIIHVCGVNVSWKWLFHNFHKGSCELYLTCCITDPINDLHSDAVVITVASEQELCRQHWIRLGVDGQINDKMAYYEYTLRIQSFLYTKLSYCNTRTTPAVRRT